MQQWCYVPTRENPADGASRGLNAAKIESWSCWFQGPPFLRQKENNWSGVKGVEMEVLSWPRINRIIGLVLCFKKKLLLETLKYWVGVQQGQSQRRCLFSLGWPTF